MLVGFLGKTGFFLHMLCLFINWPSAQRTLSISNGVDDSCSASCLATRGQHLLRTVCCSSRGATTGQRDLHSTWTKTRLVVDTLYCRLSSCRTLGTVSRQPTTIQVLGQTDRPTNRPTASLTSTGTLPQSDCQRVFRILHVMYILLTQHCITVIVQLVDHENTVDVYKTF